MRSSSKYSCELEQSKNDKDGRENVLRDQGSYWRWRDTQGYGIVNIIRNCEYNIFSPNNFYSTTKRWVKMFTCGHRVDVVRVQLTCIGHVGRFTRLICGG